MELGFYIVSKWMGYIYETQILGFEAERDRTIPVVCGRSTSA